MDKNLQPPSLERFNEAAGVSDKLFKRAYELAISCNHYVIIHDLPYLSELELAGVISFIIRLQDR